MLLIERGHVRAASNPVDAMREALRRGDALIVFPEGTRGSDGGMAAFKPGIAHLVERCPDVPIVPVHLVNMGRNLPTGEVLRVHAAMREIEPSALPAPRPRAAARRR